LRCLNLDAAGHAYNQLAVVQFAKEDPLRAVYFYIRAMYAEQPFASAKENLMTVLEKARALYDAEPSSARSV
jgi:hypothetical protein